MGEKVVCPAGGRAGGRAAGCLHSFPEQCAKTIRLSFMRFGTYLGLMPTGGSRRSHWWGPAAASAKNTEQISELWGSGSMPPGKIVFK